MRRAQGHRRRRAGAGLSLSLPGLPAPHRYRKDQVRLEGERKIYQRGADSGNRIRFYFCPNCGSNLYWEGDRNPAVCGVAVGAFDVMAFPPPSDSIWEETMHPWLGLPAGTLHYPQGRAPGM